jgi:hypothetical protein
MPQAAVHDRLTGLAAPNGQAGTRLARTGLDDLALVAGGLLAVVAGLLLSLTARRFSR